MQLAITALGEKKPQFLAALLIAVSNCRCNLLELRASHLSLSTATYLLVEGDWSQIAKLESTLDSLQSRLGIQTSSIRPEQPSALNEFMPFTLETMSVSCNEVVKEITQFLLSRQIEIEEISASRYVTSYGNTPVFSTRFLISIPASTRLLALREEFMEFCDNLNLDAILEPLKR